ncbi:Protein ANTI-SILENCING [Heracleum sosnowskyi]|uniref:Protein ANTI-SILENCING n=1 Tax=Heracleum sosnowskyi TaxID=360622 RepID=A0AAD8H0R1_9APIA|nr:Protein ANTI-SILENCING [Heracleum sosnowskyi]
MSTLQEKASEEESLDFEWGCRLGKGGLNKDVNFYKSFKFDGVEYFLNDCVYFWREEARELDIGKLVKMWETASHKRKVKTVWFLRPNDIKQWLGDVKPLENEIFLASGEGVGVSNINPPESICGKCKVVCTSDDRRNMQVSEEELNIADHTFFRRFDVDNYTISDKFTDLIAGQQVENFFNKKIDQKLKKLHVKADLNQESRKVGIPARAVRDNDSNSTASVMQLEKAASLAKKDHFIEKNTALKPKTIPKIVGTDSLPAKRKVRYLEDLHHANESDNSSYKKRLPLKNAVASGSKEDPANSVSLLPNLPDHMKSLLKSKHHYTDKRGPYRGELNNKEAKANLDSRGDPSEHQKGLRTLCQTTEVFRRPNVVKESSKWFKQKSWKERLERAHETNCLILLENLDPSYTSEDVEDIIWHAFQENVSATMVQHNKFCSRHNGRALVIFKSKDVADSVLSELNNRCLMLDDHRPVVARRRNLRHPEDPPNFFGHLYIDRPKYQKQRDAQNAVSTSHYAQQNTAEYELALHWWTLQRKSTLVWDALHKQQAKEMEVHVSQLKTHNTN